jgi:hypothetical protein
MPAHDDIAALRGMTVISKVAALKLELDSNALPLTGIDLALGLTIGEAGLNGFDQVPELTSHHAEEKDDAVLIDGLVA